MLWSSLGSLGTWPRPARFTGLSVETGVLLLASHVISTAAVGLS